ncbi:FecR family protein [Bacteroides fragilis]|nr:FecR family protein [Bacteroides fragilis]
MKQDNSNIIETLLPRYCTGQVTDIERQQVKNWMNESEENRRIVREHFVLYLTSGQKRVNVEKALCKVKQHMSPHKRTTWLQWIQRIAAVLFIPVVAAATLLVYYQNGEESISPQIWKMNVKPGMTASLTLPDSTIVYLNSGSSLSYPSFFSGKKREVALSGEAYFQVTPNANKKFIVSTPHQSRIEVLGTCFNIEAYGQDNEITTTLIKGKVNFLYNQNDSTRQIALSPSQKLIYTPETNKVKLCKTTGISETAWKENKIIFDNIPLEEILHIVGKTYNVEFIIKNKNLKKRKFTGCFNNQPLERVLEHFKRSSTIRWKYIQDEEYKNEKERIEIY